MADQLVNQEAESDLASLLKSLAGFSRQQQNQIQIPSQTIPQATPYVSQQGQNHEAVQENHLTFNPQHPYPLQSQQYPPQQYYPVSQQQYGYEVHPTHTSGPPQQFVHQNRGSLEPNRKVVDPATIIDWSSGFRCAMKTVARQDQMIYDIRKMIKTQHEHEEQWWNSRKALIEKQQKRKEGREKLASILRSVGSTAPEDHTSDAERAMEEAEELRLFDTKVYRAQHQMVKEMSTKLKAMGIPFFGTRTELVRIGRSKDSQSKTAEASELNLDGLSEGRKEKDDKIDEEDLADLQRKMLEMLEDLCKE